MPMTIQAGLAGQPGAGVPVVASVAVDGSFEPLAIATDRRKGCGSLAAVVRS
jgi:hypothetical protein